MHTINSFAPILDFVSVIFKYLFFTITFVLLSYNYGWIKKLIHLKKKKKKDYEEK